MGAYYCIYNIDKKARFSPHNYGQGAKEWEHCRSANSYLYELLILLKDEWRGDRLFNVSDYEIDDYENMDIPDEYLNRIDYSDHKKKVLTYNQDYGFTDLDKHWIEKIPEMWQELGEQYVLVNYDKALVCEIDCCRDVPLEGKYSPLPYVLMGSTRIPHDKQNYMKRWRYNHMGMERKDAPMISWMEDISHLFT